MGLYQLFVDCDLSLLEINPLVLTEDHRLVCLDAKINIDDNTMYRHPKLAALHGNSEDERENRAHQFELNYIALDGDIGCMVNGANGDGNHGFNKAVWRRTGCFLDVGGGALKTRNGSI